MISICLFIAAVAAPVGQASPRQCSLSHWERAGVTVLAVGSDAITTTEPTATTRPSLKNDPRAIRWRKTLFWSSILLFVLLVASIAIVRFSRRYAAYLRDEPAPPTASEDVWAMHRLPPDATTDTADDEPETGPDELPDDDDESDEPREPGA